MSTSVFRALRVTNLLYIEWENFFHLLYCLKSLTMFVFRSVMNFISIDQELLPPNTSEGYVLCFQPEMIKGRLLDQG